MFDPIHRLHWLILCTVLSSFTAFAEPLASPSGRVILTASGLIDNHNAEGIAQLDLSMLDSLPQVTITTATPWYDKTRRFTGPLARDLVKLLHAEGKQVKATALNDYSISIPLEDFEQYDVVLATRLDGKIMSIREKGPIFVIYPFDDNPELVNEAFYQRCIWQLNRLDFE